MKGDATVIEFADAGVKRTFVTWTALGGLLTRSTSE